MLQDKNSEEDLKRYKDHGSVGLREMNFGLWIAEHRKLLSHALVVFLILISAFFFIYSTYAYILYFMSGPLDNQPESQVLSPRNIISEMKIGQLESFDRGDYYDLTVSLENTNSNFWADFEYCFYQGQETVYCGNNFLLPSEQRYALALGVELPGNGPLSFRIEDIFWNRINRRQIPNWETFYNERVIFSFENVYLFPPSRSGLSENLRLSSLEFIANNESPYGYYNISFEILLYSGNKLVGIEKHFAKDFLAGEKRLIKMSWPGDTEGVNQVEIRPVINLMKEDNYLRYQGLN